MMIDFDLRCMVILDISQRTCVGSRRQERATWLPCVLASGGHGVGHSPDHVAAEYGQMKALHCTHSLVSDTLSVQDEDDNMPAHNATIGGHVAMLLCLHELVPNTYT